MTGGTIQGLFFFFFFFSNNRVIISVSVYMSPGSFSDLTKSSSQTCPSTPNHIVRAPISQRRSRSALTTAYMETRPALHLGRIRPGEGAAGMARPRQHRPLRQAPVPARTAEMRVQDRLGAHVSGALARGPSRYGVVADVVAVDASLRELLSRAVALVALLRLREAG